MSDTEILIEFDADTERLQKSFSEAIRDTELKLSNLQERVRRDTKNLTDLGIDRQVIKNVLRPSYQELIRLSERLYNLKIMSSETIKEFNRMSQTKMVEVPKKELLDLQNTMMNVSAQIRAEFDKINNVPIGRPFEILSNSVQRAKNEVTGLGQTLWQNLTNGAKNASISTNNLNNHLANTTQRIIGLAKSAFFFNVISGALGRLTKDMWLLIERDYHLSNSLLILKANLINAFTPIMRVILPWIRALADGLAWLAQRFVEFINWITGQDAKVVYSQFDAKQIVQDYSDLINPPKIKIPKIDIPKLETPKINNINDTFQKIDRPKFKSISKLKKDINNIGSKVPKLTRDTKKLLASFDRIEVLDFSKIFDIPIFKDSRNTFSSPFNNLVEPLKELETKIPKVSSQLKKLKIPSLKSNKLISGLSGLGSDFQLPKIKFEVDPKSEAAVNRIKDIFKSIGKWFEENQWASEIIKFIALTGGLYFGLNAILGVIQKIGSAILLSFGNPTLLAISAAIAAFAIIVKNWPKIQKALDKPLFNTKFTGNDALEAVTGWNPRHRGKTPEVVKQKLISDGIPEEAIEKIDKAESAEARWNEKIEKTSSLLDLVGEKLKKTFEKKYDGNVEGLGKFFPLADIDNIDRLKKSISDVYNGLLSWIPTSKILSAEVTRSIDKIKIKTEEVGEQSRKTGWKTEKELSEGFSNAWENIKKTYAQIKNWASKKWEDIKKWFSEKWDNFVNFGYETIKNIIRGLVSAWGNIKTWAFNTSIKINSWFSRLWLRIKENVIVGLKNCWIEISKWISGIWKPIQTSVTEGLKKCFETISNWFSDLGKNIGKWWEEIWKGLPDVFKGFLNFSKSGFNLNIFDGNSRGYEIPKLASGAVLRGGDPFLAYLNDQPRGQTNIEAPLSTIIEAIKKSFPEQQSAPIIRISADGDMNSIIRMLNFRIVDEQRRIGPNMVEVSY